jgi:hypothetical protein
VRDVRTIQKFKMIHVQVRMKNILLALPKPRQGRKVTRITLYIENTHQSPIKIQPIRNINNEFSVNIFIFIGPIAKTVIIKYVHTELEIVYKKILFFFVQTQPFSRILFYQCDEKLKG